VVNIQIVVFCIVITCSFVACTDSSKENAVSVIVILKMEAHLFSEILITTYKATHCYNPKCYSLGFSLIDAPNEFFYYYSVDKLCTEHRLLCLRFIVI